MPVEQLLYRTEKTPLIGTISDRYRLPDNDLYEFGNTEHTFTMKAKSDKIAIMAICTLLQENMCIFTPKTSLQIPVSWDNVTALFGNENDIEGLYFAAEMPNITAALESILPGTLSARNSLYETLATIAEFNAQSWYDYKEKWVTIQNNKAKITNCLREQALSISARLNAHLLKIPPATLTEVNEIKEKIAAVEFI